VTDVPRETVPHSIEVRLLVQALSEKTLMLTPIPGVGVGVGDGAGLENLASLIRTQTLFVNAVALVSVLL